MVFLRRDNQKEGIHMPIGMVPAGAITAIDAKNSLSAATIAMTIEVAMATKSFII